MFAGIQERMSKIELIMEVIEAEITIYHLKNRIIELENDLKNAHDNIVNMNE